MSVRLKGLIPEIIDYRNMSDAFDEVVDDLGHTPAKIVLNGSISCHPHIGTAKRKARYRAMKEVIIASLVDEIRYGKFRISGYHEFQVAESGKVRTIQSPSVRDRIGCNAVMRVVERHVYPTVIPTSAASIKGRGMHRLYRKVRTDIRHDRNGTRYYYKCDIHHFYQSVDQDKMIDVLRDMFKDKVLLEILIGFVRMMPSGLSIGLRSSQFFGNILLSNLDHRMKETEHARYYYRYCDDIVVLSSSKQELWRLRDIIHTELSSLGLEVKPDEAVRPTTEGLDFLGYVDNGDHTRLRKRTKHKAAARLAKVKSRRRHREIVGSFKGMAKWGDCKHLFKTLTGKNMLKFSEMGITFIPEDGKKRFNGMKTQLRELVNQRIVVKDFESDVHTSNGPRTLVDFQYEDGREGKYFTSDKEQKYILNTAQKRGQIPFETVIKVKPFDEDKSKVRYIFT